MRAEVITVQDIVVGGVSGRGGGKKSMLVSGMMETTLALQEEEENISGMCMNCVRVCVCVCCVCVCACVCVCTCMHLLFHDALCIICLSSLFTSYKESSDDAGEEEGEAKMMIDGALQPVEDNRESIDKVNTKHYCVCLFDK